MKIDAHNHPDWHRHNLDRFLENMDAHGIDQTWLLTWIAPSDEVDPTYTAAMQPCDDGPVPFARCLTYIERAPDRFVLGYAPDPRRPESIDRLQAAIDLYGVQVYGELKLRMCYDSPDALRMFRFCGEHGLPVTVHIDYEFPTGKAYPRPNWWYGGGIAAFERALAACPDTVFLGHAPGFWSHISGDTQFDQAMYPSGPVLPDGKLLALLRTYPNLHADLSAGSARNALSRDPAFGKDFVLEFQDRLLYARDGFGGELDEILAAFDLPKVVLNKLHAGNALRLLQAPTTAVTEEA